MSFEDQKCTECDSEEVFIVPSLSSQKRPIKQKKAGEIVNQFIEDTKKEIYKEKKKLKKEEL